MHILNKIFLAVALLVLIVLATLALIAPERSLTQIKALLPILEARLVAMNSNERLVMAAIGVMIDLAALALLVANLRRPPRERARIHLKTGGVAEVTLETVAQRVQQKVGELPGVAGVVPHVEAPRRRVAVMLDVALNSEVRVPDKAVEIIETVRATVEQDMGLALAGQPVIHIRHIPHGEQAVQSMGASNSPSSVTQYADRVRQTPTRQRPSSLFPELPERDTKPVRRIPEQPDDAKD